VRWVVLLTGLLAACGRIGFEHADGSVTGTLRSKPITIGAHGDLAQFPVGVLLAADADLARSARPDGFDIRFSAEDGASLAHEIELYDGATGALAAWVRVPLLSATRTTTIYMLYGEPESDNSSDAAATWPAPWAGVWHFTHDGTGIMRDSSRFAHHGLASGTGVPASALGRAGRAAVFDGVDDTVSLGDPADEHLDFGTQSFSFSMWVRVTASVGTFDMPFYKGGSNPQLTGYDIELGALSWGASICCHSTGNVFHSFGDEPAYLGRWAHFAVVVDQSVDEIRYYSDGVRVVTETMTSLTSTSTDVDAVFSQPGYMFRGELDEARIVGAALPETWVIAEYANLRDPSSFLQLGAEEQR
jgi:hypothetical protein